MKALAKGLVRSIVRNPVGLNLLNFAYNRSPLAYRPMWRKTAKIFRDVKPPKRTRNWHIRVEGGTLTVPLKPSSMWLNWDHAVSIIGNDLEVKQRYFDRIRARDVDYFVDVGANYGTHSLLFLVAGTKALSFEPNPACIEVFEEYCRANDVAPRAFQTALGEKTGSTKLSFTERETWLGSIGESGNLDVSIRTLDEFADQVSGRVLLKLDVEGYEANVIRGGRAFLMKHRPEILFEARKGDPTRPELFDLLASSGYGIFLLPSGKERLSKSAFLDAPDNNFRAVPD